MEEHTVCFGMLHLHILFAHSTFHLEVSEDGRSVD